MWKERLGVALSLPNFCSQEPVSMWQVDIIFVKPWGMSQANRDQQDLISASRAALSRTGVQESVLTVWQDTEHSSAIGEDRSAGGTAVSWQDVPLSTGAVGWCAEYTGKNYVATEQEMKPLE